MKTKLRKYIKELLQRPLPFYALSAYYCITAVLCAIPAAFFDADIGFISISAAAWLISAVCYSILILRFHHVAVQAALKTELVQKIEADTNKNHISRGFSYNYFADVRAELVRKLLVGTFAFSQEELYEHGIIFPHKYFGVVMTRLDHLKNLDPSEIPLIKYGIINIGHEVFGKYSTAYGVETNEYDIAWIVNYDDPHEVLTSIEQIKLFITDIYHCTSSFGCDFGTENPDDISDMYNNSKYALSYRLTRGYNSTIIYKELVNDEPGCEYPENTAETIIQDISTSNKMRLRTDIHSFISSISKAPYTVILTHANRLLYSVDQMPAKKQEGSVITNHMEVMTRMETLDEIESYIFSRCESALLAASTIKTDSKKDAIAQIAADYIDEHFTDPNLSIDAIAGAADKSANYTRSIFKQCKGISISDYIAGRRFDEACRLLSETDMSAQDIGRKVGISSGNYFYTAFKKHTGSTPEQYRRICRGEEEQ